jgi:homoserine acetyltransferase
VIDSTYGHDGFLVESAKINVALGEFMLLLN